MSRLTWFGLADVLSGGGGESGDPAAVGSIFSGRLMMYQVNTDATGYTVLGSGHPGSAFGSTTHSAIVDNRGPFRRYTSSTSVAAAAGFTNASTDTYSRSQKPEVAIVTRFPQGPLESLYMVECMQSDWNFNALGDYTPLVSYVAFRYGTAEDGSNVWRCVSDNGSGVPELTVTAVPLDTEAHMYSFDMRDPAAVRFLIDGVVVATHTQKLPAVDTLMKTRGYVARHVAGTSFSIDLNRVIHRLQ